MRSKFLAIGSTLLLVAGLFTLGTSAASAHTPDISADCSTLTVHLTDYQKHETNTVKVTIDGTVVDSDSDFGSSFKESYDFSDNTVAHTWKVEYTAGDDPHGTQGWSGSKSGTTTPCVSHDNHKVTLCHYNNGVKPWGSKPDVDWNSVVKSSGHDSHANDIIPAFDYWTESHGQWTLHHYAGKNLTTVWDGYTGAQILANGCSIPEPTKDASASVSVTDPTCSAAATLVLGTIQNATWGTPTRSTGPGSYSVTATANPGHVFADGKTTKTFSGTLAGVLSPTSTECAPPPCLGKSAVSYTYDAVTNSGVITVAAKDGHSSTLCHPFWVTAASWTFDGNTMWPQTLDEWNPANGGQQISSVGTYSFGADMNCGQGDIYATFTNPGVPYPTAGILNGPSDPYAEHFLHQMGFSGPNPTWSVQSAGSCNPEVVETVPGVQFTDACGTANDDFTIPADTKEIDYSYTDSRVDGVGTVTVTAKAKAGYVFADGAYTGPWSHTFTNEPCDVEIETVPAVTFTDVCGIANDGFVGGEDTDAIDYTITDNRVDGLGLVTVTAAPKAGYVFADGAYTGPWSHTFTNESCGDIAYIEPLAVDPTCPEEPNATSGYIQLDQKEHLHYSIDGVPTSLVKNDRDPGTYRISVTVDPGYTLIGESSWEMTINEPFCPPTHALLSTTASMVNITCSAAGTYTLADTPGVQWFVNGSATPTPAGTYQVTDATTVNVKAELVDPIEDGWEDGAQTEWSFTFTNPADCLPTLAFTGSTGGNAGLLIAGGLLLLGGAVIAFERRFRFGAR